MARTITFFYDIVSPWTYFAYVILKRYQVKSAWNFKLDLKPVYLGGVMVASGNKPPITVANKGIWMNRMDLPLGSKYFGIKIQMPESFPVNTINVMRFLRVVEEKAPEKLDALTTIFFEQFWGGNALTCVKVESFPKIIPTSLVPADTLKEWTEMSQTNENKERIKKDAAAVVEQGAFGFPYIVVQRDDGKTHPFFGSDRFELMGYFFGEKWNGPFPDGKRPSHL